MYYRNNYIGDIPEIILRGNINYTNMKYIVNLINMLNETYLRRKLGIKIEKISAKEISNKNISRYKTNKDGFIISDNFGLCLPPENILHIDSIIVSDTSFFSEHIGFIYEMIHHILYSTEYSIRRLSYSCPNDKKLKMYANLLVFIIEWVGNNVLKDYKNELKYDNGEIWYPNKINKEC